MAKNWYKLIKITQLYLLKTNRNMSCNTGVDVIVELTSNECSPLVMKNYIFPPVCFLPFDRLTIHVQDFSLCLASMNKSMHIFFPLLVAFCSWFSVVPGCVFCTVL